jgi:HAD superfamily hydrolase (TIGR01509 family)
VKLSVDEIVRALIDFVEQAMHTNGIPWRPGALELLEKVSAAGIKSALVTMSYRQLAEVVLNTLPAGTIEVAVTGDMVVNGKPHPEPYLTAMEKLGVSGTDCIAIEDSLTGVMSAEASGARVLGVPHMVAIPAKPNRNRANSLSEIGWEEISIIMSGQELDLVRD